MQDVEAGASSGSGQLVIESGCPECGAPVEAGLWDYSGYCGFCSSLLVFGGNLENEVFAVADAGEGGGDVLAILIAAETGIHRARLEARARSEDGLGLGEVPAWIDAKVAAFERQLRATLELRSRTDFFAPYRIIEKTVLQGVLGRRRQGAKESFVQSFYTEEMERLYDPAAYNLRDRGLKIRGFRLRPLDETHLRLGGDRFLPLAEPGAPGAGAKGPRFDRARMRIRDDTQIISKIGANWRERRLRVYKHLTYVCITRSGREEHLLIDRQWSGVAARLEPPEARRFATLRGSDASSVVTRPELRVIASECPNCGWELELARRELISFCPTCKHAVRVGAKGLALERYEIGEAPPGAPGTSLLSYPFFAFRFHVRAAGQSYRRIWDWLAAVSPQQAGAERVREGDPAESRLYVPARNLHGAPPLDDAFDSLTAYMGWRQPPTRARRPPPDEPLRMLGVELTPGDAAQLARFALLCLHDRSSTRRFNARNFEAMIADAELDLGDPLLVSMPLAIEQDAWRPAGVAPVPRPLLENGCSLPPVTKSFNLF